jgi:RNA-binding motif X-linked protein 2
MQASISYLFCSNVKNIQKLNEKVLQMGVEDDVSWHKQYKDSAYVFLGKNR